MADTPRERVQAARVAVLNAIGTGGRVGFHDAERLLDAFARELLAGHQAAPTCAKCGEYHGITGVCFPAAAPVPGAVAATEPGGALCVNCGHSPKRHQAICRDCGWCERYVRPPAPVPAEDSATLVPTCDRCGQTRPHAGQRCVPTPDTQP